MSSASSTTSTSVKSILVRVVIGHHSQHLPNGLPLGHTHRWTAFVRAPNGIPFKGNRKKSLKKYFIIKFKIEHLLIKLLSIYIQALQIRFAKSGIPLSRFPRRVMVDLL